MIDMMHQMTFGRNLMFIMDFVKNNLYLFGFLGFAYGIVLFYGAQCARKTFPEIFNDFVAKEGAKVLRDKPDISIEKLANQIYKKWIEYVPSIPSKYRIPSQKGFWIVKPDAEMLSEQLGFNEEKIMSIFLHSQREAETENAVTN